MLRFLALCSFLFSLASLAHIEKGTYKGTDQNGNPCAFEIGDTWFDDEIEHPLTERVPLTKIKFMGLKPKYDLWQMGHPAVVSVESTKVGYNHNIFQDVIPTFTGAASVTLFKTEGKSARPVALVYMEDHYKNTENAKKATCTL